MSSLPTAHPTLCVSLAQAPLPLLPLDLRPSEQALTGVIGRYQIPFLEQFLRTTASAPLIAISNASKAIYNPCTCSCTRCCHRLRTRKFFQPTLNPFQASPSRACTACSQPCTPRSATTRPPSARCTACACTSTAWGSRGPPWVLCHLIRPPHCSRRHRRHRLHHPGSRMYLSRSSTPASGST